MRRRKFLAMTASGAALSQALPSNAQTAAAGETVEILPGVWRVRFGTPEAITPTSTRHYPPAIPGFQTLPAVANCPLKPSARPQRGGYVVSLPLDRNELVYGLGLMLQSFLQRGLQQLLLANADPPL